MSRMREAVETISFLVFAAIGNAASLHYFGLRGFLPWLTGMCIIGWSLGIRHGNNVR